MPVVLAIFTAAFAVGWASGQGGVLMLPALLVCLVLAAVYVRILWFIFRQRNTLRQRGDGGLNSIESTLQATGLPSDAEFQDAIGLVASVVRVPRQKLRWSDRFGSDIGTFSALDETLDRLGGRLLLEQSKAGRPLELENIKTLGDYVSEWICCNRNATSIGGLDHRNAIGSG
jgi:hypothetical protein